MAVDFSLEGKSDLSHWIWDFITFTLKELQGDPTSPSQRRWVLGVHWKDWCWSWNSNTLVTWCEELTHLKRSWCWERLRAGGEGDDRGWDGWMTSLTRWTWVWVNSRSWQWTGKPACCSPWGCKELDTTEWLNWTELKGSKKLTNVKKINGTNWPLKKWKSFSRVQLFATPRTVTHQAPLSMGFSRQEHWSGLPFPSPGNLPIPGILYHLSHQGTELTVYNRLSTFFKENILGTGIYNGLFPSAQLKWGSRFCLFSEASLQSCVSQIENLPKPS